LKEDDARQFAVIFLFVRPKKQKVVKAKKTRPCASHRRQLSIVPALRGFAALFCECKHLRAGSNWAGIGELRGFVKRVKIEKRDLEM
jgi:hypothetical protein